MSKRSFLLGALTMSLVMVLSACGESATEDNKEQSGQINVVETVKGDIEIPAEPKRIVTDFYAGELFAVGASVVGTESDAFAHPFLQEELKGVADLGTPLNTEKVLELEPDLIVLMYDDHYEELSKIAPTLYIPWDAGSDIYEVVKRFGEVAGRDNEAEEFIIQYDEIVAEGKKQIDGLFSENTTFAIYELTPNDQLYVFGANFGRGGQALYRALDLKAPEIIQREVLDGDGWKQLSIEVLPEYAADYMFLTDYDPEQTGESLKKLKEMSIFQELDAVKNNTFFENDYDTFYRYDPIAIREQISLMTEMLVKRAKSNE